MRKLFFYLVVLTSLVLPIIFGCQKNELKTYSNDPVNSSEFTIHEAEDWFDSYVMISTNGKSPISNLINLQTLKPTWSKAVYLEDDGNFIIECPLDSKPTIKITRSPENIEKASPLNSQTTLLLLKNKGNKKIRLFLRHVISEEAKNLTQTYTNLNKTFSGEVFFTTLTGKFINGYNYKDGVILKSTSINKSNIAAREGEDCPDQTINWYSRTCFYYIDGTSLCTDWVYTGSTTVNYCNEGGGTGEVYQETYESNTQPEYYPCESSFNFVGIGDDDATWQAAVVTNYHMILTNQATGGRGEFTLNIGSIEIGMPRITHEGDVIHITNAKQMASIAGAIAELGVMNIMNINIRNNPALTPATINYEYYKTMFKTAYKEALDDLLRRNYYNGRNVSPSTVKYNSFLVTNPAQYRQYDFSQDGCQ